MRQDILRMIFCLAVVFISPLVLCRVSAQAPTTYPGALPDGATYLIEVPPNWNGTLFLYSHGYVAPGGANPAQDVGDPATRFFMLSSGFALAGSSYATTGWAIQQALPDQIAVLVDAASLNSAATVLGPNFNIFATSQGAIVPVAPAFVDFEPSVYLRPFDAEVEECDSGRSCSERASHLALHRDDRSSLSRASRDWL